LGGGVGRGISKRRSTLDLTGRVMKGGVGVERETGTLIHGRTGHRKTGKKGLINTWGKN